MGFDVDRSKIEQLNAGRSYIGHIPAERIAGLVRKGCLLPTVDFSALRNCDAAIICVPTPLGEGRAPDLTFVINTAEVVAEYIHLGELVVLESPTYPGTTDEVLLRRPLARLGREANHLSRYSNAPASKWAMTTFWRFARTRGPG
jgi:UDP-N-acetyl-D-glucosamine dehydrogenase